MKQTVASKNTNKETSKVKCYLWYPKNWTKNKTILRFENKNNPAKSACRPNDKREKRTF